MTNASMSGSSKSNISSSSSSPKPHLLVFPYPAQGHMLPLLDFTHQLVSLHNSLTITVLVTPKNLPILSPLLQAHPNSIQTLVLPFPPHPAIPEGVEHVQHLGNKGNLPIMVSLGKLFDPITNWFNSHPNPPVAIISDFFLGWTLNLAKNLNIPRLAFFSVRAFLASVLDHCWSNLDTVNSSTVIDFTDFPRSQSFKHDHLPSVFLRYKESDPEWDFVKDGFMNNSSSWGCVFNTFDAMEGEYLDHLKKKMRHGRVYGVGPLCLKSLMAKPGLDSDTTKVMKWLDGCPDGSVVYACFGSQKFLQRQQMERLALGLEQSGIRFVWVVKADGHEALPDCFEERIKDQGLILKGSAPQMLILNHPAVGGFLSHCGWNSILEGIVAGVMMLLWPMEADSHLNARLFVDDLGVAVRVCEGGDLAPEPNELSRVIGEAMREGVAEKRRAKELKDKAVAAAIPGGSSCTDFERLVSDLYQLQGISQS